MADKRPYAKIDTGYMMNPKWFRVRRGSAHLLGSRRNTPPHTYTHCTNYDKLSVIQRKENT